MPCLSTDFFERLISTIFACYNQNTFCRILIRFKYNAKASTNLSLKFGCDPQLEAPRLLQVAHDLELNVVGVSFHVGWDCKDPSAFHGAIATSRHVFDMASTIGYNFTLLDIGGGYPGRLASSIKEYGEIINSALKDFFPSKSVEIISEPGTYFVDSAFTLACNIIGAKMIIDKDSVNGKSDMRCMYYLNEGVYGSLSEVIIINLLKVPYPLNVYPCSKRYPSIIWGPTSDSIDKIVENILLPEMQIGDWVFFRDMGAYSLALWTAFNSFEPSNVYSIISSDNWLQLRNKTPFVEEDFVNDIKYTNLKMRTSNVPQKSCENLKESICVIEN